MVSELMQTSLGRFRLLALAEGISFILILFVTMPLKYMLQMGMPNRIIGMIHGILFVAYVVMVMVQKSEQQWSFKTTFLALLASIVPFGTFWADKKLFQPKEDTKQ